MNPLFLHSVSYIYWDPNPKLFLIPILEHPIMWYGMFFVIGFLGGYLILRHQFYHMLLTQQPSFQEQSFRRLDQLVFAIQKAAFTNDDPLHIVFKQLDKKTQQILLEWKVKENLPDSLVKPLLKALNQTILSSSFNKSLSFANCSKYTFHIEEILKKPYSEGLKNRLLLEVLLEKAVISYRQLSTSLADTLSWYAAIGTIVGARLGHVVFYDWDHFRNYPMEIFKTWTGGLASHGGAIGVFATLFIFWRRNKQYFPNMSLLYLLDCVTLCSAFAACMIRLGNFWNQEILGIETSLPWAIVFGHPADGSLPCPRHPVQLYESFFYLLVFFSLWKLKKHFASEGLLSGIFFFSIFGFRFFIEFLKTPQGQFDSLFFLNMGQMLSIPFVFIGIYLIAKAIAKKSYTISK